MKQITDHNENSRCISISAVFLTSVQKKCLCWRGLAGRDSAVRAALCVAPPVLIPPRVAPLCWGTPWAPARPGLGVRARSGHVRGGCEACALWGADTPVGTVRWIRVESHLRGRTRYHHTLALAWRLSPEPSRARVWQDSDRATPSTGERSREGGSRSLLACLRRYLDATSSTAQGEPQRPRAHAHRHVCAHIAAACSLCACAGVCAALGGDRERATVALS